MASKIIKNIKQTFTPHFMHDLHKQGTQLTMLWVIGTLFAVGLGLALLCLYIRLSMLEQAIAVLAA